MPEYVGTVPAIFQFADMQTRKERMDNVNQRRKRLGPRTKDVPRIQSSSTIRGPLSVTPEYKEVKDKEKKKKKEAEMAVNELDLAQLLSKKARLEAKLAQLNPAKKKDAAEMAQINIKLRRNAEKIEQAKERSGITDFSELNQGSKLRRFWERVKKGCSKIVKRVKKWYKEHKEMVDGFSIVALPIIGLSLLKKVVFKLFGL